MNFSVELEAKFDKLLLSYPHGRERAALIPMLMFAQDEVGALTTEVVEEIAGRLNIKPLDVDEVISYYTMLSRKNRGRHHLQVCTNVSCMLCGGNEIYERAKENLGIDNHGVTPDGNFSLEEVECLGACSWGPSLQVNYDYQYAMTPEKLDKLIEDLRQVR